MEVLDLRKEIEKCLNQAYKYGNVSHVKKYKDDIDSLDNMMSGYFGIYYNEKTNEYE
jgi:hypothetical protein